MKKKINILGRKVPVLAVMMVLLVIGTATAAVFTNYATLSGDVDVDTPLHAYSSGVGSENPIPIGGVGTLDFTSGVAVFNIGNDGGQSITVELETTITAVDENSVNMLPDGFTVSYSGEGVVTDETTGVVLVTLQPDSFLPVTVTSSTVGNIVEGVYTVEVAVNVPGQT